MTHDCWGPPPRAATRPAYRCTAEKCAFTTTDLAALRRHTSIEVLRGDLVVDRLEAAGVPVETLNQPVLARRDGAPEETHAAVGRTTADAGAPLCGRGITVVIARDEHGAAIPAGLYSIGADRQPTCTRCRRHL